MSEETPRDRALRVVENAECGAQVQLSEWDWRGEALRESLIRNIAREFGDEDDE